MPTIVESTISLSGTPDYSTLQSWEDASPVNLVSEDKIWKGVIQEITDVFDTTTSTALTVGGSTTDATRYKELTCKTGASFKDNIGEGALRYNESNGVAITSEATFAPTILVSENYFRMSGVQVENTGVSGRPLDSEITGAHYSECIFENTLGLGYVTRTSTDCILTNCLIVQRASGSTAIAWAWDGEFRNCTLVVPSDLTAATYGFDGGNLSHIIHNCAIFGVVNVDNLTSPTYTTCYTDAGSPPSGVTTANYTTEALFENILDGTHNYRIQSGSSLIDNGTDDATNASEDILGTSRTLGEYDVGCYELVSLISSGASLWNNDAVIAFGRANGYGNQYNDILLNWLRDNYSVTTSTLNDLLARWIKENGTNLP